MNAFDWVLPISAILAIIIVAYLKSPKDDNHGERFS